MSVVPCISRNLNLHLPLFLPLAPPSLSPLSHCGFLLCYSHDGANKGPPSISLRMIFYSEIGLYLLDLVINIIFGFVIEYNLPIVYIKI